MNKKCLYFFSGLLLAALSLTGCNQSPSDMFNLGVRYDKGQGVPQDFAKAIEWYQKAADAGNTDAMCNLGIHYQRGQGFPKTTPRHANGIKRRPMPVVRSLCMIWACFMTTV